MKDLSIVIPAYNEMERIEKTIRSFSNYLNDAPFSFEILVADDGSTDDTVHLIKQLQREIPMLRLLILADNKGKGQAVRAGMLAAEGKIRLFSDADGSTPIEEMDRVIAPILNGQAKISIGSRYISSSKVAIPQPFYRRVWSRIANKFVQRLLLPGIVDPNCGFKAFDGETATQIFSLCTVNEWSFDLEVLGIARKLNIPLAEVGVIWKNDDRTKGKLSHLPQEIKNLFIIRKRIENIQPA